MARIGMTQPKADPEIRDAIEQAQLLLDLMRESCRPSPYFKSPNPKESE